MYYLIILIVGLSSVFVEIKSSQSDIIVDIPNLGKIKGRTIETAWTQRSVYQFLDVKYAESPKGVNRFRAPNPVLSWNGTRDSSINGFGCPSVFAMEILEKLLAKKKFDIEDCLSMTITTPNITGNFPILVYIHGEFLYEGNNLEGSPEYILEKDVVLVSPQYRLGPFGFLSTLTENIPGNVGVLDIMLALHWIKYFIANFGGDPNRVTLMGQVGGAAIAHLLTLTPIMERGLFHQVIYHSGSALMPVFLSNEPVQYAKDIGDKMGCNIEDINVLNECLVNLTVVELLKGFARHVQDHAGLGLGAAGGVQFTIGGPSPVLPIHPMLLLQGERDISYPALGGCPKNVGTRAMKDVYESDFAARIPDDILNGEDYIAHILFQTQGFDGSGVLLTMLKDKFFPREIIANGTFQAMLPGLIDIAGSIIHKIPVLAALTTNARKLANQTFLYSFEYKGQYNRYPDFDEDFDLTTPFMAGVTLTDENIYLFPYPQHAELLNVIDKEFAKNMVELWTSFVIDGRPSKVGDIEWPPMKKGMNGPYMKIDHELRIGDNYHDEFLATIEDENNGFSLIRPDDYLDYRRQEAQAQKKLWKKKINFN